ncbi:MAG: prepilin-type N-terminal cleavage/methylation domain-containing protein [Dissulfurispiraceae bacterium]|jgi:MSHA pilin protein MshC
MLPYDHRYEGFTMIEVIAVLLIIGIIAAVAISKATSTATYSVTSEAEILKKDIRFAQIKSMGDVSPNTWGINIGSNSYTLQYNGATASINLPGENSPTHMFSGSVTAKPAAIITFDNWGSPGAANSTITLTGGSQTAAVTVTENTGFVP